eukprot:3459747-Lingulodinium_polyedra.AAC.1
MVARSPALTPEQRIEKQRKHLESLISTVMDPDEKPEVVARQLEECMEQIIDAAEGEQYDANGMKEV